MKLTFLNFEINLRHLLGESEKTAQMRFSNEKREVQEALRDRKQTIYILTILFNFYYGDSR